MYYNPYLYGNIQPNNSNNNQNDIIGVQSEQEARSYPVGLGRSILFRDETEPLRFYVKTMGNSPLEVPKFEKYRLVKDEDITELAPKSVETENKTEDIDLSAYALKTDLQPFQNEIDAIRKDISTLKERTKKKVVREVDYDDE